MAQIIREPSPKGFKKQLVNLVVSRKDHSETHFSFERHRFPAYYSLYRGTVARSKTVPSHLNDVFLPLIFSTIQSDIAKKAQTTFGVSPIVRLVGSGPDDSAIARKREALIDAQMKDSRSFIKAIDFYLTSDLYGTAVLQHGWRLDKQEQLITGSAALPLSRENIRQITREEIVTFDGPDWENVDLLDWFPQPGFRDVEDMAWVVVRRILDLEDIRDLVAMDMFDHDALHELEKSEGSNQSDEDLKEFRSNIRTESEATAREKEKFARPVTLLEMWGTLPSELVPRDGIRHRVITVANNTVLLRNRPNPFFHGQKPFLAYSPMPDPHFHFGPGKVEISAKLQVTANRLVNQVLDAGDLFGNPAFFYNRQSGLDTRNLYLRPGRFIGLDDNPSNSIMPISPDLRGVQMNLQLAELVNGMIQRGTGIQEDVVQGIGSGGRQTAREFLGRQEAVATRLLMEARLAEKGFVEPLADMFNVLNKQFLSLPKQILILGQSAEFDPITGEPLPTQTREMLDASDMVPDYGARAEGATSRLNRSTRQQNLVLLAQAMGANPVAAAAINWINFWRQTLAEFEFSNINELIQPPEGAREQLQMMQGGQQAEQVPGTPGQIGGEGDLAQLVGTLSQGS